MKKILTAVFLIAALVMCALPVSAEHYWNYDIKFEAAYGSPVIGSFDMSVWDASPAINISLNDDPMYARGFMSFQGAWESGVRNDDDYSGVYKVMWDENYIYFFENRTDDHVNLSGDGSQPWMTDGTLIFTQVDSPDGSLNPEGISVHIFYSVGNGSGAIGGNVMARICNIGEGSRETIEIPGARIASTLRPGGFMVEIAVPWSFYKEFTPAFTPGAGAIMGLSYVVHDSDADDPTHEKQFCYARDDSLDAPGGYDFGGWGTLELLAVPVVALPAELEEAPAAVETPAVPVIAPAVITPAPQTNDATVLFIVLAVLAIAGAAVWRKSKAK